MNFFKNILNLGVVISLSDVEKRRVRILNFISIVGGFIYLFFFIFFVFSKTSIWAWLPNFIGFVIILLIYFLNYLKLYKFARIYTSTVTSLFITFCVLIWGSGKGVEYYLFFISIVPLFFFDKISTIIKFWIFNILCFFICKVSFFYIKPLYTHPSWAIAFYANLFFVFVTLFMITYFFKKEIATYINQISSKNIELADLNKRLKVSEKKLKKLNETKNKFFSIVAHDLKNPFNILQSLSHLLYEKFYELDDDYKQTISKTIMNAIDSSNVLVENLLQWACSQSKNFKLNIKKTNLYKTVENVISILSSFIKKNNAAVNNQINKDTYVFADQYSLIMILTNLVINAIKFTEDNSQVFVRDTWNNDFIKIEVIDNGIGISKKDQKKLFKLDSDITSIGKSSKKGTGLGLILCKEFIEANKGEISVKSTLGKGSTFIFSLKKYTSNL